jgi:anti-anti-sigma regulatory factor
LIRKSADREHPQLALRSDRTGGIAILSVTGSVRRQRLPTVLRLFAAAMRRGRSGVVIDLSQATRLTSAAVAMVIYGEELVHSGGGQTGRGAAA